MTGKLLAPGLFASLLVAALLTSAVSLKAQEQQQRIVIAGAQSMVPLAEEFTAQFRKGHPGIRIEVQGGGSNYAVSAVRRGEIDIGLVSRGLTADERADLAVESLGEDAILFLTYPNNPVSGLMLDQLRQIYTGQAINWQGFGGEDKGIIALTREPSSAIHGLFINHLFGKNFNGREKAFTIRASKEKILKTIKRIEGSLGYGNLRVDQAKAEGVKVLSIEGKLPTQANIQAGLYPLMRPQLLISRKRPAEPVQTWMREFAQFSSSRSFNNRP
jgi:phosphate transport system substrate-binding protein